MANWVRSPSQRWFTNSRWIDFAFEAAKNKDSKWTSYYGTRPKLFVSKGIDSENPDYRIEASSQASCSICDLLAACPNPASRRFLMRLLCAISKNITGSTVCSTPLCCALCGCFENCGTLNVCDGLVQVCSSGGQQFPCDLIPTNCNYTEECLEIGICAICPGCSLGPGLCIGPSGFVSCDSDERICDPCVEKSCDDIEACPCSDDDASYGCVLRPPSSPCPAVCCVPGEPDCIECCAGGVPGCGVWVPITMCCLDCDPICAPFGYPMPPSFCESCEYCNIDPDAPQCANCCQCPGSTVWLPCVDVENGACNPPECAEFSANCYQCGSSYIPIWFGCYDTNPCPNPFNPDCTSGEETVCYDYNTNDPIYYSPSNLGASVIIEFDNLVSEGSYPYGNIATLCAIPDSLQLCVYLVDSEDNKTQLIFETDFTINEQAGTVTLLPSLSVSGFVKIRMERCSDNKRMFLTFKEGAKLSAEDLNASFHQLLFLIQEKEFASNNYYQVANDDGNGNPLFTVSPPTSSPFNFNLAGVAPNDVLVWNGSGGFVGVAPSSIAENMQLDNIGGVELTSLASGQYLSFNGSNWVNAPFPEGETFFVDWELYNAQANASLEQYFVQSCHATIQNHWQGLTSLCVTQTPKNLVPNAITSFGLGFFAAEKQILDQLQNPSATLPTYIANQINSAVLNAGTILSSLRWEIGRGEGRNLSGLTGYPRAFFDIADFDTLDHPNNSLANSDPNLSDMAYYREYSQGTCLTCRNKLYIHNIDRFKFNPNKSRAFGLEFTANQLLPSEDRYLKRVRNAITKKDWGSILGYSNEHPLKNYGDYVNFVSSNEMIFADYTFTDTINQGNYANNKHVPSIVTYYLANLWDGTNGTPPSFIVWEGSLDRIGNLSTQYGIASEVSSYLGSSNNGWFYWRWLITGKNETNTGSTPPQKFDKLSYYNPFDPSKLSLESNNDFTLLPASSADNDYINDIDALTMAKTGSYSIKVDANKVFSNMEQVIPDMYDEYVFEVRFTAGGSVSNLQCPDARCYEIVAKIEKYTDGCAPGDSGCTNMGSGSANTAGTGFHIYPDEFNANVVRVWDTYPYEKLDLEVRNKTGQGFDLVLKVPRLKRIGLIDVFRDPYAPEGNYRQLALDFIADYDSSAWDATNESVPEVNSDPEKHNRFPLYENMKLNREAKGGSAAAFSLETAIQFIRLGIPSNIRVSFYTVATAQSNLFEG